MPNIRLKRAVASYYIANAHLRAVKLIASQDDRLEDYSWTPIKTSP